MTRIKDNANYELIEVNQLPEHLHSGVLKDVFIEVDVKEKIVQRSLNYAK